MHAWAHTFIRLMAGEKVKTPAMVEEPQKAIEAKPAPEPKRIATDDANALADFFRQAKG